MSIWKRFESATDAKAYARALSERGLDSSSIRSAIKQRFRRSPRRAGEVKAHAVVGNVSISVTGIAEIDAKLAAMPVTLRNKALRKGCREVAKITLKDARARAPKASGKLAKSLVVKATKISRKNRKFIVGVSVTTKEGLFQGDEFYGGFLELGTQARQQKTTGRVTGSIDKQRWAFLRPALVAFLETKHQVFQAVVTKWMNEQAGRQLAKYNAARGITE